MVMEEKLYKMMLHNFPFAYAMHKIILDDKGVPVDYEYIEVNNAFEKFTGLKKDNIIGKAISSILPTIKSNRFNWIDYYGNIAINGGEGEFQEYLEEFKRWYKVKAFSPKRGYFVTFFVDITNELMKQNLYKSILSSLDEGLISTNQQGYITMINEAGEKLIGLKKEQILNKSVCSIFRNCIKEYETEIENKIGDVLNTGNAVKDEETLIINQQDGKSINLLYKIYPIKNANKGVDGTVIGMLDITDRVSKQNEIDYITYHDTLTGIYNRNYFNNEIKNIDKEDNMPLSVIMGDVNGLKLTNDAFGHLLGDKLLETSANIMKNVCRKNDYIIRWGGDEFIILLPETEEKDAQSICDRIKAECDKEKVGSINLSISLGCSTKNNIYEDIMETIKNCEEIMYRIKMIESKSQKSKTLKIITQTLQEKSIQDVEHSRNVSGICKIIGSTMKLSKKEISELEILGDIHDIGKVAIDESILNKEGPLNDEEWVQIKKHSEIGYHIAMSSADLSFLADSILAHHEWYNGSGYPKGLAGEEIPLYARILAIADAFDSMTSYRPYKEPFNKGQVIYEFKKFRGTQFDPDLVDVFVGRVIDHLM
jgi:diguanylate cyclase (GGDEF)-like protein/PAS domain S-box-containing protein